MRTCILLALVLLLPFDSTADKPAPDRVAGLTAQLSATSYKRREAAQQALIELGTPVLPALKKSLAAATDLETRRRLKQIIRWLAVQADPRSAGLGCAIYTNLKTVRVGQKLTLTVTLLNTTRRVLHLGTIRGQGQIIEQAERLRILSPAAKQEQLFQYKGHFGCGTGLPTQKTALQAGQRRTVTYTIKISAADKGLLRLQVQTPSTFGIAPYNLLVKPGTLRISYLLSSSRLAGGKKSWSGTLRRTVKIKLVAPRK